jgi:hypothetical protein
MACGLVGHRARRGSKGVCSARSSGALLKQGRRERARTRLTAGCPGESSQGDSECRSSPGPSNGLVGRLACVGQLLLSGNDTPSHRGRTAVPATFLSSGEVTVIPHRHRRYCSDRWLSERRTGAPGWESLHPAPIPGRRGGVPAEGSGIPRRWTGGGPVSRPVPLSGYRFPTERSDCDPDARDEKELDEIMAQLPKEFGALVGSRP